MGIAGGALLPMAYGHFADASGPQSAYWVMLPCYVFILFYATLGHKLRHWGDGSERALKRARAAAQGPPTQPRDGRHGMGAQLLHQHAVVAEHVHRG